MNQVGANEYYRPWGAPYRQRIEGITVGAGNAKAVNEAAMVIDPWPPLVNNRRIPANGARMTGVIERYKDAKRLREQVPTLPPDLISSTGTGGSGGGGGGQ
ncbi:hypothetical protein [Rhodomicrobium vannielii]|nr:hypothetical protein [Rhodomicrobium vannielii]